MQTPAQLNAPAATVPQMEVRHVLTRVRLPAPMQ